jgi:hypothetical protein
MCLPSRLCGPLRLLRDLALLASFSQVAFASTETWTGNGANSSWTTNANWSGIGGAGAGDDLIFPDVGSQQLSLNNFPINTNFSSLTFTGFGYTITGAQIFLGANGTAGGIDGEVSAPAPAFTFAPNIILGKSQAFNSTGAYQYSLGGVIKSEHPHADPGRQRKDHAQFDDRRNGRADQERRGHRVPGDGGAAFGLTTISAGTLSLGPAAVLGNVNLVGGTLAGSGTVGNVATGSSPPNRSRRDPSPRASCMQASWRCRCRRLLPSI